MVAGMSAMKALVDRKIQDEDGILSTAADIYALIDDAVNRYSIYRPQNLVEDETGTGGFDYQIAGTAGTNLLASWEKDFSIINKIIYPVDDTSATETVIDVDDWAIITKVVSGTQRDNIRFLTATPTSAETFRVFYSARHVISIAGSESSTVATADDEAIANLASSLAMQVIAARYSSLKDSSIDADATDYVTRASEALRVSETYHSAWMRHMGISDDEDDVPAAGYVGDLDMKSPHQGGWLFHEQRRR